MAQVIRAAVSGTLYAALSCLAAWIAVAGLTSAWANAEPAWATGFAGLFAGVGWTTLTQRIER